MDKLLTAPNGPQFAAFCGCATGSKPAQVHHRPAVEMKKVDKKGEKKFDTKR